MSFDRLDLNQQTKGSNRARTVDVTRTTGTQQQRPEWPILTPPGMQLIKEGFVCLFHCLTSS